MCQNCDNYVSLHNHTEYSLLDGHSTIPKMIERVVSLNQTAVGISDHGVMYGVRDFVVEAVKAGVKPVVGMEAYLATRSRHDKEKNIDGSFHLLLFAKNQNGYRNLSKLSTVAQTDGFYRRPRIDKEILEQYHSDLIVTTGCVASPIPQMLLSFHGLEETTFKDVSLADIASEFMWYKDLFGDDFYVEVQPNKNHKQLNQELIRWAKQMGVKVLATTDSHYPSQNDYDIANLLLDMQMGRKWNEPKTGLFWDENLYYIMSGDEITNHFGTSEYAQNTLEIAEKVDNVSFKSDGYLIPQYNYPENFTSSDEYLRYLCDKGIVYRYTSDAHDSKVQQRLEYELSVIAQMGFADYFLIVWDICQFMGLSNIWFNTRGSAAGSIVAYALGITSVDPIMNDLLFERFLNPDRVSMPDIDLDIDYEYRAQVVNYTVARYGSAAVAAIITMGKLRAKNVFRDVARVYEYPLDKVSYVTKHMETEHQAQKETLEWHKNNHPELEELYNTDPEFQRIFDNAAQLQDRTKSTGIHAAGIVLSPVDIVDIMPLSRIRDKNMGETKLKHSTQFPMETIDDMGMLKIDYLGLKTITIIRKTCELIKNRYGVDIRIEDIPYYRTGDTTVNEQLNKAFQMMQNGHTAAIFQLEGKAMTDTIQKIHPTDFHHIAATIALYRPGPMDYIDDYVAFMRGEREITYHHPKLEPILKDTYSIIVYQEQLLRIANELFGFPRGEADLIRKAVSKKKEADLKKHRAAVLERAPQNGIDVETAKLIWNDFEKFANYGFNRSHSSSYAMMTVKTAVLKSHYPLEYICAALEVYQDDADRFATLLSECPTLGIKILPPSINTSGLSFTIDGESIRYGLSSIKGVGQKYIDPILSERNANGQFKSLEDFIQRVDPSSVNKRVMEALIKVGAFETFGFSRYDLLGAMENIQKFYRKISTISSVQMSFWNDIPDIGIDPRVFIDENNNVSISPIEQLEWEKELLGRYVSQRPTDYYQKYFKQLLCIPISWIRDDMNGRAEVSLGGTATKIKEVTTAKNKKMAFVTLEDHKDVSKNISITFFPDVWKEVNYLKAGDIFVVIGKVEKSARYGMGIVARKAVRLNNNDRFAI